MARTVLILGAVLPLDHWKTGCEYRRSNRPTRQHVPSRASIRAPSGNWRIYSGMIRNDKELIVVGDRVLVKVDEGEERTHVGLYLPSTAVDSQAVQGGTIMETGPGTPMPSF